MTERSTSIRPPAGVYLTALDTRLSTTCANPLRVDHGDQRAPAAGLARVSPAARSTGRAASTDWRTSAAMSVALALEVDRAALDLSGLQQVGDQPVEPVGVALDHPELRDGPRRAGRRARGPGW